MAKTFRDWNVNQTLMFQPSVHDFVPEDHLARFVRDTVVENLDLTAILETYTKERGFPPYDPTMMTALLLYAYCQGVYASRRIAKACEERVDFMAVTAMQKPDLRTISDFRKRHLSALKGLFVQVLQLCRGAGLVKLGHVALDGTKIRANASKHKAMSYARLKQAEPKLAAEVVRWLREAQAAVDSEHQVIVAQGLSDNASDATQLVPMVKAIKANTGRQAKELSADAGYCSEDNLKALNRHHIRGYIATGRQRHGQSSATAEAKAHTGVRVQAMQARLKHGGLRSRYRLRKQIVEPVFGQIKQARGLRQCLLRGLDKAAGEWSLLCTAHNLLKIAAATR